MMKSQQMLASNLSRLPSAKNYFVRKKDKLLSLGRLAAYAAFIPAVMLFSARNAFSQNKDNAAADSSKPVPALLTPLNLTSATRNSPFAYLGQTQIFELAKFSHDGTRQSLSVVGLESGQFQASLQHDIASKDGKATATNGIAAKYSQNGITYAARVAVAKDYEGKISASADIAGSAYMPYSLPVIVTLRFGTNEDLTSASTSAGPFVASITYKDNAKNGTSVGAGGEFALTYSSTAKQRFYLSYEHSESKQTKITGSRLFLPFGTVEADYEWVKKFLEGNVIFRVSIVY